MGEEGICCWDCRQSFLPKCWPGPCNSLRHLRQILRPRPWGWGRERGPATERFRPPLGPCERAAGCGRPLRRADLARSRVRGASQVSSCTSPFPKARSLLPPVHLVPRCLVISVLRSDLHAGVSVAHRRLRHPVPHRSRVRHRPRREAGRQCHPVHSSPP